MQYLSKNKLIFFLQYTYYSKIYKILRYTNKIVKKNEDNLKKVIPKYLNIQIKNPPLSEWNKLL